MLLIWASLNFSHLVQIESFTTKSLSDLRKWPLNHYQTTNFRLFKTFGDDNIKFNENGRRLFKRVENTVGKGENVRYEQFFLFPQCFQKACFPGASKGVIVWKWVKKQM